MINEQVACHELYHKTGIGINYNDGSAAMASFTMGKAAEAGLDIDEERINNIPWQLFRTMHADNTYDALLCLGYSIGYVNSWGNNESSTAKNEVMETLCTFYRMLRPGRILLIDIPNVDKITDTTKFEDTFQGRHVEITSTFHNDIANRIRDWPITVKDLETGKKKLYHSQGYLLLEEEFVPMLHSAGFVQVKKHKLSGNTYDGIVAVK